MPLPSGTTIRMSDVNAELGRAWNQAISLNDPQVRQLAGKPSGTIHMSDLWGKANIITIVGGNADGDKEYPFYGFMIPNSTWNKAFGSASTTSFGGGELTSIYARAGQAVVTVRGVDLGHALTIQVNGSNFTLYRDWAGGANEHQYKLDNQTLEDILFYAGLRGQTFTVKRV